MHRIRVLILQHTLVHFQWFGHCRRMTSLQKWRLQNTSFVDLPQGLCNWLNDLFHIRHLTCVFQHRNLFLQYFYQGSDMGFWPESKFCYIFIQYIFLVIWHTENGRSNTVSFNVGFYRFSFNSWIAEAIISDVTLVLWLLSFYINK